MLTTSSSSPTVSASPSPSAPFHPHARPYHASHRPSTSPATHSPRFHPQVATAASSRRLDSPAAVTAAVAAVSAHSPAVSVAKSPRLRKRETVDAGTQYSPPNYPPTFQPSSPATPNTKTSACEPTRSSPQSTRARAKRRETSDPVVTEPQEPQLRADPQKPPVAQDAAPPSQGSIGGDTQQAGQQQTGQPEGGNKTLNRQSSSSSSSSKRARPHDPSVKVMPLKYENCDIKDLGVLVSDMLMELVRLNDGIPLQDGQLTRFHSRAPPGISVRDYLFRLIVHATISPPILLSMVYYVDRLCALYPAFTISSLTVHRFLITAVTVAAKGLSDSFWTNSTYARVGGVSVRELALLELEFLRRLEWRIVPKPEVLVDYYRGLVERGEGYTMEKEPEPVPQHTATDEA
ncbi:cyclin-domain-containing protein [Glonium stellatum]|uniref:Cyclin-domain-containing protein n=1 Tax=Glonium stellatum TaxID=574774 RepID=A0A8E2EQD5_9PEZI|nr:cyclin-domain-containing protein [Glonium stellatum]